MEPLSPRFRRLWSTHAPGSGRRLLRRGDGMCAMWRHVVKSQVTYGQTGSGHLGPFCKQVKGENDLEC